MAELVDAHDLKSCEETHAGSIPAPGTKIFEAFLKKRVFVLKSFKYIEFVVGILTPLQFYRHL